jgi:hypothetical protein
MWINFKKLDIKAEDLVALCAISQKEESYVIKEVILKRLLRLKYIKELKKGGYITTKEGNRKLTSLSTTNVIDEEANIILDWLIKVYKDKPQGIVKNKTETARRIQWFKNVTKISGNQLVVLLKCFIEDTYSNESGMTVSEFMAENKRGVLSNMLDNVCFKPKNIYQTKYSINDSPLYTYYKENEEYVHNKWSNLK